MPLGLKFLTKHVQWEFVTFKKFLTFDRQFLMGAAIFHGINVRRIVIRL
jgi:hypothetical protein